MNELELKLEMLFKRVEYLEMKSDWPFLHFFNSDAGKPHCTPDILMDVWGNFREACDLAREALEGSRDEVHHEDMMKRLKALDSKSLL